MFDTCLVYPKTLNFLSNYCSFGSRGRWERGGSWCWSSAGGRRGNCHGSFPKGGRALNPSPAGRWLKAKMSFHFSIIWGLEFCDHMEIFFMLYQSIWIHEIVAWQSYLQLTSEIYFFSIPLPYLGLCCALEFMLFGTLSLYNFYEL